MGEVAEKGYDATKKGVKKGATPLQKLLKKDRRQLKRVSIKLPVR